MHKVVRTVGFAASRISVAAAVVVMVIVLVGAVILYTRYHERRLNEGAVDVPAAPSVAWGEEAPPRTGRFEASLSFTDLAVSHELVQDIVWDDGWFFQDSETYDPELARACSVIAALAYSESGYYQQGSSQPAYMEQALAELGFTDVSTDSYRYRSEVVDEALSLVTDESDGAAYAVATKRIEPDSGSAQVGAAAAAGSDGAGAESASGDPPRLPLRSWRFFRSRRRGIRRGGPCEDARARIDQGELRFRVAEQPRGARGRRFAERGRFRRIGRVIVLGRHGAVG